MEKKVDVTNSEAMEAKLTRVKNGSFPRLRRMEVSSFHPWLQSVQRGVKYIIALEFVSKRYNSKTRSKKNDSNKGSYSERQLNLSQLIMYIL
ncbi:hypothetical protein YC2023_094491 [Brassica napus]